MEKSELYRKIVYKKNALSVLCNDLKLYYPAKKVLIITTKSLAGKYLTEIINSVSMAGCEFFHFVAKNNFSKKELCDLSEKMIDKNPDLIICLGAGKATNVARYFSSVWDIEYFVCVSSPSSLTYFGNLCVNPFDSSRSFNAKFAEKIYIQESIIKTSPRHLVKQGVYSILAMQLCTLEMKLDHMLVSFGIKNNEINHVYERLKNELMDILTGDDDSKLVLMDLLIELGYCVQELNLNNCSLFNYYCVLSKMLDEKNKVYSAGELLLLCSKTLIQTYESMFKKKKIERYFYPDFVKISNIIESNNIFTKKIKDFNFFNQAYNQRLLQRMNNIKEELCYECNTLKKDLENTIKRIKFFEKAIVSGEVGFENVFSALQVLPFIHETNCVLDVAGAIGLLN